MEFKAVSSGMGKFSTANESAAATISAAGSPDSAAMTSSVSAALGPIGAKYLSAYAPAQSNNIAATKLVADVHAAIGGATLTSRAAIVAADNT